MDDTTIRTAATAWITDATATEATYGHISTWETSGVTDMSELFKGASSFNEDISAWDTSGVTAMSSVFSGASSFNQDLSAWDTSGVKTMYAMFYLASAFDQDLGWCFDDSVQIGLHAFVGTACSSTSCGVEVGGDCAPAPRPAPRPTRRPTQRPTPRPIAAGSPTPRPVAVAVSGGCDSVAVSGSDYQTSRHGTYLPSGRCEDNEDKVYYKCSCLLYTSPSPRD